MQSSTGPAGHGAGIAAREQVPSGFRGERGFSSGADRTRWLRRVVQDPSFCKPERTLTWSKELGSSSKVLQSCVTLTDGRPRPRKTSKVKTRRLTNQPNSSGEFVDSCKNKAAPSPRVMSRSTSAGSSSGRTNMVSSVEAKNGRFAYEAIAIECLNPSEPPRNLPNNPVSTAAVMTIETR